jgi:hypothetical protein
MISVATCNKAFLQESTFRYNGISTRKIFRCDKGKAMEYSKNKIDYVFYLTG